MGSHPLRHKVLLPQLKMIVIILMALLTCGGGEQIPPPDGNTLILMNVIDTLGSLSQQLKEIQEEISAIDESQKSGFRNMEELQQCSTEAQLSHFQELVFKDPCEDGSHNCSDMSTCTDYVNRYECSCLAGYSGDGFTCQDVDECLQGIATCGIHELCSNTPGSYTCHCQEGYRKEGDTCQDVDECREEETRCPQNESCLNKIGSYRCICPLGYKKVGDICQGPVCELSSVLVSEIGCLTLVTERLMSWNEGKSKCEELGGRLAEGIHRRHFQALSYHFWPMIPGGYALWVGLRRRQWIHQEEEEERKIIYEDWHIGEPDGDLDQCGFLYLHPSYLGLVDYQCSSARYLLCQSLP